MESQGPCPPVWHAVVLKGDFSCCFSVVIIRGRVASSASIREGQINERCLALVRLMRGRSPLEP